MTFTTVKLIQLAFRATKSIYKDAERAAEKAKYLASPEGIAAAEEQAEEARIAKDAAKTNRLGGNTFGFGTCPPRT